MPPRKVKRTTVSSDVKDSPKAKGAVRRGKTGKTTRRRGWGGLKDMLEMPTDIIFEILRLLHPRDLLSVSWASHELHAYLIRKSSAVIWKESLKNAQGLPPCPAHLTELAYASFIFGDHCTKCGTSADQTTYWEFYARVCYPCGHASYPRDPVSWPSKRRNTFDRIPKDMFNKCRNGKMTYYSLAEVEQTMDTWEKLVKAKDDHELALFIGTEILRVQRLAEHASRCCDWVENTLSREAEERQEERAEILDERYQEITSRLRALGWGLELDFIQETGYEPFEQHKQFRVAKKLTDRMWKNMRENMLECMQKARVKRLASEEMQMLCGRQDVFKSVLVDFLKHPSAQYGARCGDFAFMPGFREVMCAPADVTVNKESFKALEAKIGEFSKKWYKQLIKDVRDVFQSAQCDTESAVSSSQNDWRFLDLATTVFLCKKCTTEGFLWSTLRSHACLRKQPLTLAASDIYGKFASQVLSGWEAQQPIAIKDVLRVRLPYKRVHEVMELCGKDSRTVTAKEMDALDVRFVRDNAVAYTWRAMAFCEDVAGYKPSEWRMATAEEVAHAKEAEAQRLKDIAEYSCKLCIRPNAYKDCWYHVTVHLSRLHNIEDPSQVREQLDAHVNPWREESIGMYKTMLHVKKNPS